MAGRRIEMLSAQGSRESFVLCDTQLREIIDGKSPLITTISKEGIIPSQVQPSSLDLTLGCEVFGMGYSSFPRKNEKVSDLVKRCQYQFTLEEGQGGFLHRNYAYIVPLNERLSLPPRGLSAKFSPKSSTGRTDVFVRVLADGVQGFDEVPEGYRGDLYLEIIPLSFPIRIRPGLSLTQMRLRAGDARLSGKEVTIEHSHKGIFFNKEGVVIPAHALNYKEEGVYLHVDLDRDVVGFTSRTSVANALSLYEANNYDPLEYWEPIRRSNGSLVLERDKFYLLATKERVRIPTNLCGDIAAYDASTGEFRTHYAGFFDPGFGGENGITGVMEVRGRENPHSLSDGSPICLMVFERVYPGGSPYQGHYQNSGPSLSKHFKNRYEAWGS